VVGRQDARRSALQQLLQRFFDGSPEQLMASLFESGEVDRAEFRRLRKLIDQAERKS
jgi:predicted transcriptional regulator